MGDVMGNKSATTTNQQISIVYMTQRTGGNYKAGKKSHQEMKDNKTVTAFAYIWCSSVDTVSWCHCIFLPFLICKVIFSSAS